MYWCYKKKNNRAAICGSMVAVAEVTAIKIDTLYYHFSREKRKLVKIQGWDIRKKKLKRASK